MPSRGTYRTVHCSLVDDPEFQLLSSPARLIFHTLRLSRDHRASGIFRYYIETIMKRSGLSKCRVEAGMKELSVCKPHHTLGWIVFDPDICWVVNGLRYDPQISLANPNHVTLILRELSELPRNNIVLKYCKYYNLPIPSAYQVVCPSDHYSDSDSDSDTDTQKDSCSDQPKSAVATPHELDPDLAKILQDCPHLHLISNGDAALFWDQVLKACQPYGVDHTGWIGVRLRTWNQWFDANKHRRSKTRPALESRLMKWLAKDLDALALRKPP